MLRKIYCGCWILFALILVGGTVSGLHAADEAQEGPPKIAPDSFWEVVAIDGKIIGDDAKVRKPNMKFVHGNTEVSGFTGCNRFFGAVVEDKQGFRFNHPGMTQMACLDKLAELESKFMKALNEITSRRMVDSGMELLDAKGVVRMSLQPKQPE